MSAIRNKLSKGVITIDKARRAKRDILYDLDELEKKPYGWDSDGSFPLREDVAREVRHRLMGDYGMDLRNLPTPDTGLSADGTFLMEFAVGKRKLIIEVMCGAIVKVYAESKTGYSLDTTIKLAKGGPATGYTVELDAWTDWLLEDEPAE